MKSRSKELLDRAIAAMLAAIEIYNKPGFTYRDETFTILAINGWELVLKAKWLVNHDHKINCLFVYEQRKNINGSRTKKSFIKRTRSGNPFTHSIEFLANKMIEAKDLDPLVWSNIQALIELRDSSVHFYNASPEFRLRLQEIGAACVKNFTAVVKDWFNKDLSEFDLYLMPLSFIELPSNFNTILLNTEEKNFLHFVNGLDKNQPDPASPFSVTVNIEVKFIKSKAQNALAIQVTNNPDAPEVRITEENIREKYPWDYKQLTEKCKQRYTDFICNNNYHALRKKLQSDSKYAAKRFLDPGNVKSTSKVFFSPNILKEFDKEYKKKSRKH